MTIAFPGAEGYGANAQGGRGGSGGITVYTVSNLNNSGSGSLREAIEASGPRIVVFNVSGHIRINSTLDVDDPYITILGQTAPSPGITITRGNSDNFPLIDINADDVIIRYIRFAHGEHVDDPGKSGDSMQIGDSGNQPNRIMIDHCELWWCTDETLDLYQESENVTIQWTILGDPIHYGGQEENQAGGHGFGALQFRTNGLTMHHNLYLNVRNRHPRIKSTRPTTIELSGNVHYNLGWTNGSGPSGNWGPLFIRTEENNSPINVNIENEYVIIGPDAESQEGWFIDCRKKTPGTINVYEDGTKLVNCDGDNVTNVGDYNVFHPTHTPDNLLGSAIAVSHAYPVTLDADADEAYARVIACVGVTVPGRDTYTNSRINGIPNCTSRWLINSENEAGGLPSVTPGATWVDTDGDGIPDYYEFEQTGSNTGLTATDLAPSGYLWVEEWAISLVADECTESEAPPTGDTTECPIEDVSVNDGSAPLYDLNETRLFAGDFAAVTDFDYQMALRYQIDADPDATFTDAALQLYVTGVNGADTTLRVYGILESDAAAFGTEGDTKTRLANTTVAFTEFTIASTVNNQFITTPSIVDILEELVAQVGWANGNDALLVVKDNTGGFSVQARAKFASVNDGVTTCPKLSYTVGTGLINAGFNLSPTTGITGGTITFTDTSSATNGISGWLWDFGDGNTSVLQNPTHVYTLPNSYNVSLTVSGPDGSDDITKSVLINISGGVNPETSNKYEMNSSGTITMLSSHPSWAELLNLGYNLMGTLDVAYNIFTGLGQAIDPLGTVILTWNIDTGVYEVTDATGINSIDGGTDARLAVYGTKHSGSRGEAVWDAYQLAQATEHPGWVIQPWPAMFEIQYVTAQTLL